MRLARITTALLWVALAACTEPRSIACKEVCKREAECIDSSGLDAAGNKQPFDEKECIAACAALEHDVEHSAAKVQRHVECVSRQATCPGVLECK
ncbi:MAG TPA: hypothetical protein VFP84_22035 [Kofleriaceae bacterium]|nr:hypothetical protein [Kofleriaceae bacterium]